jgi:phosphohistidine phosphatase SixA
MEDLRLINFKPEATFHEVQIHLSDADAKRIATHLLPENDSHVLTTRLNTQTGVMTVSVNGHKVVEVNNPFSVTGVGL